MIELTMAIKILTAALIIDHAHNSIFAMSKVTKFILLSFNLGLTLAQGGDANVDAAVRAVGSHLDDRDLPGKEAEQLQTKMSAEQLRAELIKVLFESADFKTGEAAFSMILGLKPFPFEALVELEKSVASSRQRAELLSLLNHGTTTAEQSDRLVEIAKLRLSDRGAGHPLYGEAAAMGRGSRVCDMAYTVLNERLRLTLPAINRGQHPYRKRNQMILELAKRASIPVTITPADDPEEKLDSTDAPEGPGDGTVPLKTQNPEPQSTTEHWGWIAVVMALGLRFFFIWRRGNGGKDL